MAMKVYARVADDTVFELLRTDWDIATMFHADIKWVEVTDTVLDGSTVDVGWTLTAFGARPPARHPQTPAPLPTMAQLQVQLATLTAQIAALHKATAAAGGLPEDLQATSSPPSLCP